MGVELMANAELLSGLNAQQAEAVRLTWGPSLVVAGAGSGKTTVLTRRVAYLLSELRQEPDSILCVTFTNKAAQEMRQRLEQLIGPEHARRLWIGTFHSICARLLRSEIESFRSPEGWSWKGNFVIYDESDTLSIIKGVITRMNLDEKVFAPKEMRSLISSWKNDGLTHSQFASQARTYKEGRQAEIFSAYQQELARNNALDFDDLILMYAQLLKHNPQVHDRARQRFMHILVDEFQDTNQSQYELIRALSGWRFADRESMDWGGRSLMVVGDVDQSIYSWRKADFRIILGFQGDFKNCQLIKLEENYRSTATILEVANDIIRHNSERIEKVLRCNRSKGSKVRCFEATDEIDEAYFVVEELKKLTASGRQLSDCVVLYRTNAQSRAIEEVLVRSHLPYAMVGATRFYDRQEVRDIIAYLKLVYNGQDGQSFLRIVNMPRRGLGKTAIDRLASFSADRQLSLLDAAELAEQIEKLSGKAAKGLKEFAAMVRRWQMVAPVISLSALVDLILKDTRYVEKLEEDIESSSDELAEARIDNLKEFAAVAREFEAIADSPDLESFLTRISLVSDLDSADLDGSVLRLMTLHSAKGLESPVVFLTGLEQGLFPHFRSLNSPSALEEERRLMYVGVTRAKDLLYLSYARKRMMFQGGTGTGYMVPSCFLREISREHLSGYYPDPESSMGMPSLRQARLSEGPDNEAPAGVTAEKGNGRHQPVALRAMRPKSPLSAATREPSNHQAREDFEHLVVGDSVQHARFGIGKVVQVIGEGDKELYNVDFAGAGRKLLDPRFAKLVKLN